LKSKQNLVLHAITYIVFGFGLLSILFKVMHWPFASNFLSISLVLPFVVFLPIYLYTEKDENPNGTRYLSVILALCYLSMLSLLLVINKKNIPQQSNQYQNMEQQIVH